MNQDKYQAIIDKLDKELDAADSRKVGIFMGTDLFAAMADRRLLKAKLIDMILGSWTVPSYRDFPIAIDFDMSEEGYRVGVPSRD